MTEPPPERATPGTSLFTGLLLGISALLVAGGAWWRGVDFGVGALVGSSLVVVNYLWTGKVVRKALLEHELKSRLAVAYAFKFGLSVLVLFLAVLHFDVDPLGILLGVSAVFLTGLAYAAVRFTV